MRHYYVLAFLVLAAFGAQAIRFDPSGQPLSDLRPVLVEPHYYQPRTDLARAQGYPVERIIVPSTRLYAPPYYPRAKPLVAFATGTRYSTPTARTPSSNTAKSITVYARNGECSPSSIWVRANTRLHIRFVNEDDVVRGFSIPGMGLDTPKVYPQDSHTIYAKAPDYERNYDIHCS